MQIRGTWSAGPDDDQARFLADLRALRDSAAIGHDELAARAHYPSDILEEAENGPCLPGLPILTAYVRACEGDVLDWEERWRKLNPGVEDDPGLPVRPAGASAAAVAGARAAVGVTPADVYDPERIRAALRGDHARSDQAARTGEPGTQAPVHGADGSDQGTDPWAGTVPGAGSGWDAAASTTIAAANGNHSAAHESCGPSDPGSTGRRDSAEDTEAAQASDFSWLQKTTPENRPAPADLEPPAAPLWRADEPVITRAPRPETTTTSVARASFGSGAAAPTQPAGSGGAAAPQATAAEADNSRGDRSFPVRLLVVIVIAALIGSVLVLILK